MKLSSETLGVLKNFGNINQGIFFKKGKTLKTVSSHKNILAEVFIQEEIPKDFGIYDLNNFLSVVSLHKDDPSFEFDDKHLMILGNKGRSKIKYRFCEPTMIVTPPEKSIVMPDAEIVFDLSLEDFDWVLKAASVLSSPNVSIQSDGEKVNIITLDTKDDSAHTDSLEICDGNGDRYNMIFKTENLTKIMSGSYEVSISSKGVSLFVNKKLPLKYWISIESGSNFEKSVK
jgi:hypothetical protein